LPNRHSSTLAAAILTGAALSLAISALTAWPAPISLAAIAGELLFFWYYPARKAFPLIPIEAPRYERGVQLTPCGNATGRYIKR
jgi:hypothetical protein